MIIGKMEIENEMRVVKVNSAHNLGGKRIRLSVTALKGQPFAHQSHGGPYNSSSTNISLPQIKDMKRFDPRLDCTCQPNDVMTCPNCSAYLQSLYPDTLPY